MSDNLEFWSKKLDDSEQYILAENFRHLKRHIRKLEAAGVREKTIVAHIQFLMPFAKWCKTCFTSLTEDDIFDYIEHLTRKTYIRKKQACKYTPTTIYQHKVCVKTFLRPLNQGASDAVTLKKPKRELPEILVEEDINAMLSVALNARDRALISFLYESGARKGEFLSIRLKHITFDENGAVVILPQGKTGSRRIRIVFASSYLREWLGVHPAANNRESTVFCALRDPFPPISDTGLHYQLCKLAKRAGVLKPVNPHAFRHAAATRLAKHLTEQELKVFLGWTAASTMAATYVHLAGEDIDDAILRMNNIQSRKSPENSLSVGRCPRCKDLNPETSSYCGKCGLPLHDAAQQKLEEAEVAVDMDIIQAALLNPAILEEIAKRVGTKLNTP